MGTLEGWGSQGGRSGWYVGSLTLVQNKVEQIKKIGTSISLEQ